MSTPDEPNPFASNGQTLPPLDPSFAPVTVVPEATPVIAHDTPATPPQRKSPTALIVVLLVTVASLTVLAAYLWVINSQWQSQNVELRQEVAALSTQVNESAEQIVALEAEVAEAEANLEGATGKVTDLADASANAQDQSAYLTELTESFSQCAEAQSNHISHLQNASQYTASSLAEEGRDVEQYCDDVQQSYSEFLATNPSN